MLVRPCIDSLLFLRIQLDCIIRRLFLATSTGISRRTRYGTDRSIFNTGFLPPYVYPSCCTAILPVGYARMFLLADGATISANARNNAPRSNDLFFDIPFNIE